ncbi:MAG: amidase, partial [Anaerolineales bacterium]
AGAIFVGHHNMHEIALGVTTVNPHYGACHNPWNTEHICGGSSGGSAAAIAAGLCFGALGTDTGGSIRIPASLCGVVGFKPTFGRVSVRGVLPLSWNLDHVGPLAKCVEDAALIYHVIAGYDKLDPYSQPKSLVKRFDPSLTQLHGKKIALASDEFFLQAQPEVVQAVKQAAQVMRQLGAIVEEVAFPNALLAAQTNSLMVISDAAAVYQEQLQKTPQLFGEDILQRLQNGAMVTSSQYVQARHTQTLIRKQFNDFFKRYDALLTPTTPVTAPLIQGENALEHAKILTKYTAPFNLSGLPAISLPCGFDSNHLPIGLQIVSKAWNEEILMQIAYAYEQATEWHKSKPSLSDTP